MDDLRFASPMDSEARQRQLMMRGVMGALAAWGILLAVGSFLGIDRQTPDRDFRRLLVVAATTGGFLLFWLAALRFGKRRQ